MVRVGGRAKRAGDEEVAKRLELHFFDLDKLNIAEKWIESDLMQDVIEKMT